MHEWKKGFVVFFHATGSSKNFKRTFEIGTTQLCTMQLCECGQIPNFMCYTRSLFRELVLATSHYELIAVFKLLSTLEKINTVPCQPTTNTTLSLLVVIL